jgi:hypothetical protein
MFIYTYMYVCICTSTYALNELAALFFGQKRQNTG